MPAIIGSLNSCNSNEYPDERRISRQLVRMIGSAKTWQDAIEASDALFHIENMARGLRSERDMAAAKDAVSTQSLRQAVGQQAQPSWIG